MRKFFTRAKATDRIRKLPTDTVKMLRSVRRSPKGLEKREFDQFLRRAEQGGKKRDAAIVTLLRHTGLRVAELCTLHLDDIDMSERNGALKVRDGKGNKYRGVPLNVDVRRALGQFLLSRPRVADAHFFVSQKGGALQQQAVRQLVEKYAWQAGLEDVSPHAVQKLEWEVSLR